MPQRPTPNNPSRDDEPCGPGCDCDERQDPTRRRFLAASVATAGWLVGAGRPFAGPFAQEARGGEPVPADKKLSADWIRSLYERGEKTTYADPAALRHIGMPVGGLFAGTVYLSGDGRLWLWDIFNRDQEGIRPRPLANSLPNGGSPLVRNMVRAGLNYLEPAIPDRVFDQGFALLVGEVERSLDLEGFSKVRFDGRYPIGRVTYEEPRGDAQIPISVELTAYSPFIPLRDDDSSLPATVLEYAVTNHSNERIDAKIVGRLENAVCLHSKNAVSGRLRNRVVREPNLVAVECTAAAPKTDDDDTPRNDIVFEDFENERYEGWTVEGDAFGTGPVRAEDIPEYQGDVGGEGERVVNSHATAPGTDIPSKDARVGKLISPEFKVSRRYVRLLVGGGAHRGATCVDVRIDGESVASVTGRSDNRMRRASINLARFEGKRARIEIVDEGRGGWGNIGVDHIVFSDRPAQDDSIEAQHDYGSMVLAALIGGDSAQNGRTAARASRDERLDAPETSASTDPIETALGNPATGDVQQSVTLEPGETKTVSFVLTWHFPNLRVRHMPNVQVGHEYAARFDSALDVARYVASHFDRLSAITRRWVDTWYDSTLPYWLLDRTMANTSTLATTTCYRFRDGRFWAWEGIGCCPGTCTHVWHYAQAVARLFPGIERDQRSRVDFGLAQGDDGGVGHRAYIGSVTHPAVDGHCGRVLGVYREHQMSRDADFLREIWPRARRAIDWLIAFDANGDGVLEGAQHNTLDAAWYGKIPWLTSLYIATLRAGEAMALELGDEEYAGRCRAIADRGAKHIAELFDGEYFVQLEDPAHADAIGTGRGCHIDQIFGQTWAHWVGLGSIFDRERQVSALRALWKFNFVPDLGPFRQRFPRGRWYAAAGDAGLVMCTWPKGGESSNYSRHWQYGYFNECMTGFEWQAAAHMIYEGLEEPDLLEAGLAVSRAIHDRYDANLRNPYNEVECSDHYSRAMASYGVLQAVCGFEYHGPQGRLAFAPRIQPENFRAPFTAAEGWGSYSQRQDGNELRARIELRHGTLTLRRVGIRLVGDSTGVRNVAVEGKSIASITRNGNRLDVELQSAKRLEEGEALEISVETEST